MDNRPIGVFDSGIGGLPILSILVKKFPMEDFIYLGDNNNVPYGNKRKGEIKILAQKRIEELFQMGAKVVVVACNTASLALDLQEGENVVGLSPFINALKYKEKQGIFFATQSTVSAVEESGVFREFNNLKLVPLPLLASQVEKCVFCDHRVNILDHLVTTDLFADFIYLGCTHYLYLKSDIARVCKTDDVLNGSEKMIEKLTFFLEKHNLFADNLQAVSFVGENSKLNSEVYHKFFKKGKSEV